MTLDPFDFPTWELNGPSTFQRTDAGHEVTYVEGTDYIVAQFSGAGDVSGPIFVAGNTTVPQPPPAGQRRERLCPGGLRRHAGRARSR